MSEALAPKEQRAVDALAEAIAKELSEGKSKKKIVNKLVRQGWAREAASQFVAGVELAVEEYKNSPEGRRAMAEQYKRRMLYGILWAVGGIVVTLATYSAASSGGTYIIAWGAILWGAIDFLRGFFGWLKYKA